MPKIELYLKTERATKPHDLVELQVKRVAIDSDTDMEWPVELGFVSKAQAGTGRTVVKLSRFDAYAFEKALRAARKAAP